MRRCLGSSTFVGRLVVRNEVFGLEVLEFVVDLHYVTFYGSFTSGEFDSW